MSYTIGEISKRMNIAPSALRYYEKMGVLPSVGRTSSGLRQFSEDDVKYLQILEHLKRTGMPIRDIKAYIELCRKGDSELQQRMHMIDRQNKLIQKQIESLRHSQHMLDFRHWYYETAIRLGGTSKMNDVEIPEEFHDLIEDL